MNKSVLLIITGSIAAVKVPDLVCLLRDASVDVTCVCTKSGAKFIAAEQLESLTGQPIYTDLFNPEDPMAMDHIHLSRRHDMVLVAPASADFLAKMTHGFADDLASTLVLASNKPTLVAPAMNVFMWEHAATQRNMRQLKRDGIHFIGPGKGSLACGEEGWGRMEEPAVVVKEVLGYFEKLDRDAGKPLLGKHAVVTSGPTREKIDPVRYITNRSSGKQGYAIAQSLAAKGADVTLVSGPTSLPCPKGVKRVDVESALEMYEAVHAAMPADIAVCCAAVADWRTAAPSEHKIKKQKGEGLPTEMQFTFAENPDILVSVSKAGKQRPHIVVGFAAETEHVIENARVKLETKGCDWIIANNVLQHDVFESDHNSVHFVTPKSEEDWGEATKQQVADRLVSRIVDHFVT